MVWLIECGKLLYQIYIIILQCKDLEIHSYKHLNKHKVQYLEKFTLGREYLIFSLYAD